MVDGRFEKIEGTDFELPCELVLLAMGFLGPERDGLLDQLGVDINERGNVTRDAQFATNRRRRVRLRRHGPRAEPHRVGDRRGPLVRRRRRRVPDGRDRAARADPTGRPPADLTADRHSARGAPNVQGCARGEGVGRRRGAAAVGTAAAATVAESRPRADRPRRSAARRGQPRSRLGGPHRRPWRRDGSTSAAASASAPHVVLTNAHLIDEPVTFVTLRDDGVLATGRIERADGLDLAVVVTNGPDLHPDRARTGGPEGR